MRAIGLLLLATVMGAGLTVHSAAQAVRVAPEEAEKNLVRRVPPEYPALARQANITGIVILEIKIDETGAASYYELISGHPMLVEAAIKAVAQWKYRPFEMQGKPVMATTYVAVPFGFAGSDAVARAEKQLRVLTEFRPLADAAQTAIGRHDYDGAIRLLGRMEPMIAGPGILDEKWFWLQAMGQVSEGRNDLTGAERFYLQALDVYKNFNHESSEEAATNASLGQLYLRMGKVGPAREHLRRALAINRKFFKRVDGKYAEVRQALGEEIAHQAALLAKLGPAKDVKPYCETLREFDTYLKAADRRVGEPACK